MILEPMSTKYTAYLTDESRLKGECEDIVFAETEEEVSESIKLSLKDNKKVTLQGARTGLSGACVPNKNRVINLSKLNNLGELEKTENGAHVHAQCGVTLEEISKLAESKGYIFPVNATEETASLGGMFSTNAEGPNSLYYAPFSAYVKSVNFTFPSGEICGINRGEYVIKDKKLSLPNGKTIDFSNISENLPIAFYKDNIDLIDFLAGKEGYFGAATSFELELLKKPNDLWGIVFFFDGEEKALNFADSLSSYESESARITTGEYFNEETVELIINNLKNPLLSKLPELPKNAKTAIYVELESDSEDESEMALMDLLDMFAQVGGNEEDTWAQNGKTAVKSFRDMRHAVVSILNENMSIHCVKTGARIETDIKAIPEKYRDYLKLYNDILNNHSLKGAVYGCILKNHLHVAILADSEEKFKEAKVAESEIYKKAIADNALIGAKYGIGKIKKDVLLNALSDAEKEEIKKIRLAFDPNLLMNP